MLQRYLLLWLVLLSAVAFYWTELLPAGSDPFRKEVSDWYLRPLIVVTMFAIGVLLPRDELRQVGRRWPSVLAGVAVQYTTMPLLAFLVAKLGGFEGDDLIGLVMVGCVPGAMASNVLTLNARGNTSYSVSLTATATLLSPLAVPLALGLVLSGQNKVTVSMLAGQSVDLLFTVVVPVVIGHLMSRWAHRFAGWPDQSRRWGSLVANLAILLIIAAVVGRSRASLSASRLDLVWALLLINVGGYCAGYASGLAFRLPESMRRALTLEVGM